MNRALPIIAATVLAVAPAAGQSGALRVINAQPRVEWLGPDECWFRREGAAGTTEFIRLDLSTGATSPLLDPGKAAAALSQMLGAPVEPAALPIESLTVTGRRAVFLLRDRPQVAALDLDSYALTPASPADLGELRAPLVKPTLRSRNGGGSSGLLIVNSTASPVSVIWIDTEGAPHKYATMEPGASHRQHTYAGHAWSFEGPGGVPLGSVRARREPRIVIVDGPAAETKTPADEADDRPESALPRDPLLSPDGSLGVVFEGHNAGIKVVSTGERRAVTTDGTETDFYEGPALWSPDGTRVVVFRATPGDARKVYYVQSSPPGQVQPVLHSYDYPKPGDRLPQRRPRLLDAATGAVIPISEELFPNPWSIDDVRWDADSSRFTFVYNQRGHQALRVIAVDGRTGQARAIIDETSKTFIDYSQKYFRHDLAATGEIVWASERDGWNHLYLVDARTGEVKNQITSGPWVVRGVDLVDEDARQVWFRAGGIVPGQDPYYVHLARVNLDGSGLTILTAGDGTHSVSFSPDRRYLVDQFSRVDLAPVTEIRRASDGTLAAEVARAEVSGLEAAGRRLPTRFVAKGRDGSTDIYGIILWPRGFRESARYPVVESIYAGPHGAHVPKGFMNGMGQNDLTDRGFIVVQIDGMGTNWRSRAFHDVCWKNIADAGFPDRIAWIKAAAVAHPQMDLENGGRGVGIFGGSAGGQNALRALIDHHDFYKVAVADCGCHDNRMDKVWWNEAWMGWPVGPEYEASSNVAHAARLEGKLLLMVGEMDENVDPASTMQVVNALVRADKDFDMLVLPNAGHGSAETPYGRRRRLEYFLNNLAPPRTP